MEMRLSAEVIITQRFKKSLKSFQAEILLDSFLSNQITVAYVDKNGSKKIKTFNKDKVGVIYLPAL